jgi:hypothetical protein
MSQYDPLYKWLQANSAPRISVTFKQIEEILGFRLPNTARKDPAWWANEKSVTSRHVQCRAWLDAGFHTENLSIPKETVAFVLGLSQT